MTLKNIHQQYLRFVIDVIAFRRDRYLIGKKNRNRDSRNRNEEKLVDRGEV